MPGLQSQNIHLKAWRENPVFPLRLATGRDRLVPLLVLLLPESSVSPFHQTRPVIERKLEPRLHLRGFIPQGLRGVVEGYLGIKRVSRGTQTKNYRYGNTE